MPTLASVKLGAHFTPAHDATRVLRPSANATRGVTQIARSLCVSVEEQSLHSRPLSDTGRPHRTHSGYRSAVRS